jgi:hypothetical protein
MGHALAMYESDFGFQPGAGDVLIRTNNFPWLLPSTNSWTVRILPYVGAHPDIFSCPDYEPHSDWNTSLKSDSFGYNAGGSSRIYFNMERNLGLGFGKGNSMRSTALAAPADMIELGDLQLPGQLWCNIISPWHKRPLGRVDCVASFRRRQHGVLRRPRSMVPPGALDRRGHSCPLPLEQRLPTPPRNVVIFTENPFFVTFRSAATPTPHGEP